MNILAEQVSAEPRRWGTRRQLPALAALLLVLALPAPAVGKDVVLGPGCRFRARSSWRMAWRRRFSFSTSATRT